MSYTEYIYNYSAFGDIENEYILSGRKVNMNINMIITFCYLMVIYKTVREAVG